VMKRTRSVVVASLVLAFAGAPLRAQTPVPAPTPAPAPVSPADAFFDDSVVHSLYLSINGRDWQSLRENYLDNSYYPCALTWNNQIVRSVGIRSRGTGSRSGVKPGLRVDFDYYTTGQTFLGLKSFILRNQTQDPSNMHERISMGLFRRMGVKTSREAFTKLYINNVYSGVYSIVESVDKGFLQKSFDDNEGHLYKYDYNTTDLPYYFEDRGTAPSTYVPHPFKPETKEDDPEPEKIADFVRILNNDSEAVWRMTIDPYIDWENFLRHIAIETVLADQDGFNGDYGINNFYWYRLHNLRTFVWIPWDKSEAFKNGPAQPIFHNILDGVPARRNRLSGRAMTSPDLQDRYLDLLIEAANALGQLDPATPADTRGWMEREIDREYAQIRDLVYSDTFKPFANEQFEADVAALKAFARERPSFVVNAVADFRKSR
jgi:spore coat protein CotH